jgi:UPF0042 nucleotide-binding protein
MHNKPIVLLSFSFRQGLPEEADMVIDARFLKNPFYDPTLSAMSGLDKPAGDYIEADPDFVAFFQHLTALLVPLLPRYLEKDRPQFTLAVGCTGGRHRSVYTVEKLAGFLRGEGYAVTVRHRDLK